MLSLLLFGFILYSLWAKYYYLFVAYPEADASAKWFHLEIHYHLFSLVSGLVNDRMNPATSLFRRLNIRDLVSRTPTYSATSDVSGNGLGLMFKRWATKKTAGSTKNGRDSKPKNLGVKKFGGERVIPGNIIVRQRGTRFHPGNYVGIGKDHTLYAVKEGCVKFEHHKLSRRKWVHVEPKDGHALHPVYSSAAQQTVE